MTRLLLTLLALLTGIVAQTAPAAARVSGTAGAEVTIQLPGTSERTAIVRQAVSRPTVTSKWNAQPGAIFPPPRIAPVPAVLTGIDRARE